MNVKVSDRLNRRLTDLAMLLICGRLTGNHLWRSIGDTPMMKPFVGGHFRNEMLDACEQSVLNKESYLFPTWLWGL